MMIELLESRCLFAVIAVTPSTAHAAILGAANGDTFELHGNAGNYGALDIDNAGVTLRPFGDGTPHIVVPTTNSGQAIAVYVEPTADNCTLDGLDISGGYSYALKVESTRTQNTQFADGATHLTVTNCKIHDSGTHVVKISPDCDDAVFQANEIYNSGRRDANQGQGVDAVNVDRLLFTGNYVHGCTQNDIFVKGGSTDCLITDNKIVGGWSGIYLGQDTDLVWFDIHQNPNLYESINCTASGNTIINAVYSGIGFGSALNATAENNTIRNSSTTGQSGIRFFDNSRGKHGSGGTVFHNVVWVANGHFVGQDGAWDGPYPQTTHNLFVTQAPPFYADDNGDWVRNVDDYLRIDQLLPLGSSGPWWQGDTNNDGQLNIDDYLVLDQGVLPVFP